MQLLKLKSQVRGFSLSKHAGFPLWNKRPWGHKALLRTFLSVTESTRIISDNYCIVIVTILMPYCCPSLTDRIMVWTNKTLSFQHKTWFHILEVFLLDYYMSLNVILWSQIIDLCRLQSPLAWKLIQVLW